MPDMAPPQFPPLLMSNLTPLVTALRGLPLPSTHPSHPAAPAIQVTLMEAQKGYADMRGQWCRKSLENQSRRTMERVETMEGVEGGREFGKWVQGFLNYVEVWNTPKSFHIITHILAVRTCSDGILSTFTLCCQRNVPRSSTTASVSLPINIKFFHRSYQGISEQIHLPRLVHIHILDERPTMVGRRNNKAWRKTRK